MIRSPKTIIVTLMLLSTVQLGYAQILKKIKDRVKEVQDLTTQVNTTSAVIAGTTKNVRETWRKDTSRNIKYEQLPDYRSREEVTISKKQQLKVENGEFVNLAWEPVTDFSTQIFPSFIIGWASYKGDKYKDMGSSLGFRIKSNIPGVVLKWEIESVDKSYFKIDSGYVTCKGPGETMTFMPKVAWDFRELTKHQTAAPLGIYFRLIDPVSGAKVEKLVTTTVRSINDCLTFYDHKACHYMYAAYVNEDHPAIDKVLKDALDTKMINDVIGYQAFSNDRPMSDEEYANAVKTVDMQVAAIWRVLHDRGFKYSSITNNSAQRNDDVIFSQTVRTFDNAINTSQANCVDGTVMMASILKRIGLRPVLVLVPGHCFLGYYKDGRTSGTGSLSFVETTMLSSSSMIDHQKESVVKYKDVLEKSTPKGTKLSEQNKAYYLQFLLAKASAMDEYEDYMKKANAGNGYVNLVDVTEYRKLIAPIPSYF